MAVDGGSRAGRAPNAACTTSTIPAASRGAATTTVGSGIGSFTGPTLLAGRRPPTTSTIRRARDSAPAIGPGGGAATTLGGVKRLVEVSLEARRPDGYRRRASSDVVVGDEVWFVGLHQSRTGMVLMAPVRGRVVAVWPTLSRLVRLRQPLTLEVQLDGGQVRHFPVGRRTRLFVGQPAQEPATPPDETSSEAQHG